jgi:hypothetical protein
LHNLFWIADCVPDPGAFDPESDTGQLARQLQLLFQDAEENPPMPVTSCMESSTDELDALALSIGDKVLVGGVKVSMDKTSTI